MNAATEFDLGPLTWVKGEIDLALERADEALKQCLATSDATQLKFCRTHVHQVQGALAIVGLDGVTQVIDSLEAILLAVEEGKAPGSQQVLALVGQSIAALRQYLDDLMAGEPNQPLRLLPVYRALAAARGAPPANPTDLFFPDLSQRPPRRAQNDPRSPQELQNLIKNERARFQKGLLAWLKRPDAADAGIHLMREALTNIEATQDSPAARTFWWVAIGFAEALADRNLASEPEARQLCARIDLQIRRLQEGSRNVAERLMRDALYYVARAPEQTGDAVRQIRTTFKLGGLLPASSAPTVDARIESLLRRLRETVNATEELWNKFCAGSTGMLNGFAEHAIGCAGLTAEIGHTDLKRLGQGLATIAKWLQEKPARHNDAVAMEVATAILLLQKAQENFRRLGSDFAQQVNLMVTRLRDCVAGKASDEQEEIPLLDEMTRRAQEKLLIGQVAREIQSSLGQIEQALDTFFRDPEKKQDLAQVEGPLKQVSGALTILGHDSAIKMLADCSTHIRRFSQPDYMPVNEDFEVVAQHLSMLGFFVDSLQHGTADFDTFSRALQGETAPDSEEADEAPPIEAPNTVEAQLEKQKKETQALVEALKEKPEDSKLKDELKQNLQALQKDADLVADRELGETAKAALSALNTDSGEAPAALDAALASLKPIASETPTPSAETLQLAQSSMDEVDAELLSIFIEEAHEVLDTIASHLEILKDQAHNTEALTTIRRSTHTLKGSGRMVGLKDFGEVAWAIEQTLNQWLRQEINVSPEILELISLEHSVFTAWVDFLENRTGGIPDARTLIALADRLRGVEAPEDTLPATPAAPVASAQETEPPASTSSQPASSEVEMLLEEPETLAVEAPPQDPDIAFTLEEQPPAGEDPVELQDSQVQVSEPIPAISAIPDEPVAIEFGDVPDWTKGTVAENAAPQESDISFSLDDLSLSGESSAEPAACDAPEAAPAMQDEPAIDFGDVPALTSDVATDEAVSFEDLDLSPEFNVTAAPAASEISAEYSQNDEADLIANFDLDGKNGSYDSAPSSAGLELATGASEESVEAVSEDLDLVASFDLDAAQEATVPGEGLEPILIDEPDDANPDAPDREAGDAELAGSFDFEFTGENSEPIATLPLDAASKVSDTAPIAEPVSEPAEDTGLDTSFDLTLAAESAEIGASPLPASDVKATDFSEIAATETADTFSGLSDEDLVMSFDMDIPEAKSVTAPSEEIAGPNLDEEPGLEVSFEQDGQLAVFASEDGTTDAIELAEFPESEEPPELLDVAESSEISEPEEDPDFGEMPELTETVDLPQAPEPTPAPVTSTSPTLYDIFREEAAGHMRRLKDGFAALEAQPAMPTAFEMVRGAHTLGGIAATVGLMPINKLAITLEHALLRRDNCPRPDSIEGLETVRQAILTLDDMFATLAEQRSPEPQPAMVQALEEIYQNPLPTPEAQPTSDKAETESPDQEDEVELEPDAEVLVLPQRTQEIPQLQDELDEQLLPIFLEEAQDLVKGFSEQLRAWRAAPGDSAAPRALARLMHTFKGSARMAGAMNLGEATHVLEARIEDILHSGNISLPLIEEIENSCDILVQLTDRLQIGESATLPPPTFPSASTAGATPAAGGETKASVTTTTAVAPAAEPESEQGAQKATLRVRADLLDRLVNEAGELSISRARIEGEMRGLKTSLLELTENVIRLRRQLREIEIQAETQMQAHVAQSHTTEVNFDPLELDRFTRFQELTRFMAESVNDVATLQQNLLKNLDDTNAALLAQARLNRSLQQELMGVRMVPFESQSERLYRIVRQTAKELGKRANLDIRGGQVEIDRSVLDKMLAPLEHMLRNSLTHGIETREERVAKGKAEIGEITLSLQQEGNEIILAMADDGSGLDPARIRTRAEATGLLAPGEEADETRLFDFIFHPGFSTASKVTQIAGRGVGMDVVRTEVASLGGRIEIQSALGQGTTFRLYLPLTLAVTQTLLVRVGSHTYAVPSTMIEQVQEVKEKVLQTIQEKGRTEWMGHLYPLHFLPNLLGDSETKPEPRRQYWILLLRSGTQRVAIHVDELQGNHEVVVKNIGPQLARVVGIAGATVLGDGQVVLILNPVALASRSGLAGVARNLSAQTAAPAAPTTLPTVMVVDDSLTVRKITGRLLTREGYQVVTAKDGVDALEQLLEVMPDVILSDVEMPRMDGFDLVRNIRADNRLKHLPVIMITSRTAEKHRNYAIEIGASDYLGKPYDEDKLLALISGFVKTKRLS